ncbi:bifunctional metallophosphatase/5'-nucleotidase [Haloprofundus marisrubri]|uniref:Bifunctional metallophosphatase/5'-nucleotidase n=1 Tax=Haloprofundus marisrubri TaxID=1514971 RepID=A0A0W1R5M5_9EURY|nr:5'-nucleotidase C-terminal domain-containing protein [Haloprofundus marisrubri]KTG08551.1 bifunctional metallophosphatase/5'-nucleotidase [Haloprofundus marisrubri]
MPRLLHYSDIENVYDDPERAGRLAGLVSSLGGPDSLVVGSGDNTSPGVLALVSKGRQALDFFHAVDSDVETFGNHDFDYGPDATRQLVADAPQTWVSANVRDESGERFGRNEGVTPWTVESVAGDDIGFFGVTDPTTDSLNPMAAELGFDDPYEAAERAVSDLRAEGVDYVVAVSHLGAGDDELAKRVDVDAILGGHVHSKRVEYVHDTLLLRPGVNGWTVLELTLDDEGARAERHELDGNDGGDGGDGSDEGDAPNGSDESGTHDGSDTVVDESLVAALRSRLAESGLDSVVGEAQTPMQRTEDVVFGGECAVGNFVADAYRWAADADVGLQNSGGIRNGPALSGEVTVADLVSVVPFAEPVVVAELTGEELLTAFRQAAGGVVDFGEPHWWHGHVSGATVRWDDERRELLAARVGGEPVDTDRLYRVATAEYLLHSDHEFPVVSERHRAGEFGIQHEILAEYAREFGVAASVEGRIRRPADD